MRHENIEALKIVDNVKYELKNNGVPFESGSGELYLSDEGQMILRSGNKFYVLPDFHSSNYQYSDEVNYRVISFECIGISGKIASKDISFKAFYDFMRGAAGQAADPQLQSE